MTVSNEISDILTFSLPPDWSGEAVDYMEDAATGFFDEITSSLTPEGRAALQPYVDQIDIALHEDVEQWPSQYSAAPSWNSEENSANIAICAEVALYSDEEFDAVQKILSGEEPLDITAIVAGNESCPLFWVWNPKLNPSLPNSTLLQTGEANSRPFSPDADLALVESIHELRAKVAALDETSPEDAEITESKPLSAKLTELNGKHVVAVEVEHYDGATITLKETALHTIVHSERQEDGWLLVELRIWLSYTPENEDYVRGDFERFLNSIKWLHGQ